MRLVLVLALATAPVACARGADRSSPPAPAPAPGPAPAPAKGTVSLGEPITAPVVALADLTKDPARYVEHLVATRGKVTAVCKEMGCWLDLEDATARAHVRIHGHSFFVPRTAPGHVARVQAKVLKSAAAEDDCEDQGGGMAKIELEATGVEID